MRVLTVIDTLGYGGAERLLVSLLPVLVKQGIDCQVAVAHEPYSLKPELEKLGITVHCLNICHRWSVIEASYKLAKICKKNKMDIIWGHLYFGNLYAAYTRLFFKSLKVVWTFHSTGYTLNPPSTAWQRFRMRFEEITAKYLVSTKVGVSNSVIKDYQQTFNWSMQCIYNGIPVQNFPKKLNTQQKIEIRKSYNIPKHSFLIVVPARYDIRKGYFVLCEALDILKNKKNWQPFCICASHGYLKTKIQERLYELKLDKVVTLLEPLKQYELFKLIQSSNAVVLPSLDEAFGIAAAEAMALEIPVILSNIGGFKEVVGDSRAALVVPKNEPQKLADAIWQLYSDKSLQQRLAQQGQQRIIKNFDITVIANEWVNLFFNIK